MHALSNWVTQIILMIMFAMILELLLPNEGFSRYVKTVIGLILILILLSPIMTLFHTPVDTILNQVFPSNKNDPIKNSLNEKKIEIELGQRAYISKQMAVQMKSYVKGELSNKYGLVIQNLDLQLNQNNPNEPVEHVSVTLEQARSNSQPSKTSQYRVTVAPVNKVSVDAVQVGGNEEGTTPNSKTTPNEKAIQTFLANQWNLSVDQITLHLKGGDT